MSIETDAPPAGLARGRLRIFVGAAPGVGKTYAMLVEGHHRRAQGTDVAVAFVETHGRRPIAEMTEGLEVVPRRSTTYRGMRCAEMDLNAVLARHPQVALVDELAHTNVPGCGNAKRWQDVEELLAAGIDVITTLNVQHLESLNDTVEQITGVVQRERLPDAVARRADQIELVDLSVEALRRRLAHGDVYPTDRIEAALTHYFRPGNLAALRELALLWVADRVEEGLQQYRAEHGIGALWEARERIVIGLAGDVGGETIIRRAARIAARTPGCDLTAVHVTECSGLLGADPALLARQRTLVESLGGRYQQVVGNDIADDLLSAARAQNATQIVLGVSRRGRCARLLAGEDVTAKVIRLCGPINVHIVTHEGAARPPRLAWPRIARGLGPHPRWYAIILGAVLLPVLAVALTRPGGPTGPAPPFVAGLAAVLGAFLVVGAVAGLAFEGATDRARQAVAESTQASILSILAADVLRGQGSPAALLEQLREAFGLDAVSVLERRRRNGEPTPEWYVAASAGPDPPERPEDADVAVPARAGVVVAGRGRRLSVGELRILTAYVAHVAALLAERTDSEAAASALEQALATAVPTLRAALGSAQAELTEQAEPAGPVEPTEPVEPAPPGEPGNGGPGAARASLDEAVRLLSDLDDLYRLETGALDSHLRPLDLGELADAVRSQACAQQPAPGWTLPEPPPLVIADRWMLTRALGGLLADAVRRGPPDRPVAVTAAKANGQVQIRIVDHRREDEEPSAWNASCAPEALGALEAAATSDAPESTGDTGLTDVAADTAFRLAQGLAEATGGTLRLERTAGGGRTAVVTLPAARRPAATVAAAGPS
ncbi:universal stress protein [Dactylosporangium sp. NPDC051484]|uniref:universal stress protein n=1 Tax=Dactylosporangium sp. NPDC051484 TaxID=3154942 RepID=UPI00344BB6CA